MRRLPTAAVSATVAAMLILAGCSDSGSGDSASPSPSASDAAATEEATEATPEDEAALEAVTVEGEAGAEPTLSFEQPFTVSAPVARVASPGSGAPLEDGQMLTLDYVQVNGADGSSLGSTYGATPASLTLGDPSVFEVLNDALTGQQVGVRVLFAAPAQEGASIMALEVKEAKTVPTRAEGTPVEPREGLPTVTLAENGEPSIEPVKDAEPPTELVVQPLITGTGPAVQSGQNVTFQYSGWLWNGEQFDSSWEKGAPFTTTIGTGQVIQGWDQGLVGQPVGSQVLLVIPPELGYGDKAQGESIPANSTLVFVVDILAAS